MAFFLYLGAILLTRLKPKGTIRQNLINAPRIATGLVPEGLIMTER